MTNWTRRHLLTAAIAAMVTPIGKGAMALPFSGPAKDESAAAPVAEGAPGPGPEMGEAISLALASLWRDYVQRFVTATGRVVDNGNGNISHSEGQGYALVLAARAGDRETFDRVLAWTERELIGTRTFAAWRWQPDAMPHITDDNNATDGDILIAWGLVLGSRAFDDPTLLQTAERRIRAIREALVVDTSFGPTLIPGQAGFSAEDFADGPVLNPSYYVFPALSDFAAVTPDLDWPAVRNSGFALLEKARFGPLQLPTEWVAVGGDQIAPAAAFAPEFGYNAIRIPLYLAMDADAPRALSEPYVGMWNADENVGPFTIDVVTGEARDSLDGFGYKAIFALSDCMVASRQIEQIFQSDELYYPATLGLLAIHRLSEDYSTCM